MHREEVGCCGVNLRGRADGTENVIAAMVGFSGSVEIEERV